MRILHTVESYLPLKHGMSEVVKQISERLVVLGHDVTVATSSCSSRHLNIINGVKIKSFNIKGNFVEGFQGEVESYKSFLLNEQYDIVVNFAAQQWATDICIEILPNIKARKVFVPTGFSELANPAFALYFEKMKIWMKMYDMNVFLSDNYRDINFARNNNISKLTLIPNGAAKDEFLNSNKEFDLRQNLKLPKECKLIIHVGSYTYVKGHEQALNIFLKSKLDNVALVFIGSNFKDGEGRYFAEKLHWYKHLHILKRFIKPGERKELLFFFIKTRIKYLKKVFTISLRRDQLIAAYQQADLFLFPSMIECSPIVLFEAIASKTPFLVTDVGNSKEIIDWTRGGELLPTIIDTNGHSNAIIDQSAQLMKTLLSNTTKLKEMSENGYLNWLNKFTWEEIALQYEKMYVNLKNQI